MTALPTHALRRPRAPRLVVSFIAGLALLLGPLAFAPAQAAGTFTVSGVVTGEGAGPLEDVTLKLQRYDTQDEEYVTEDYAYSDLLGTYVFSDVPGGASYRVTAERSGTFAGASTAPFVLTANRVVPLLELARGGSISGTLTETGTGTPLPEAYVQVFPWDGTETDWDASEYALLDEDGRFVVEGLAPGAYKVQAGDHEGNHVAEWYDDAADAASGTTVTVAKGVDSPLGTITLDVGAMFTGTLEDEDGDPVDDPAISALRMVGGEADWTNAYNAKVDEDGRYVIQGLPTGSYKIELSSYSDEYFGEFYDDRADEESADAQDIVKGDTKHLGTSALAKAARVTGTVLDAAKKRFEGVGVAAYAVTGGVVATDSADYDYTDEDGTFALKLRTGTYELEYFDGLHRYLDKKVRITVRGGEPFAAATVTMVKKPVVAKKKPTVTVTGKGAKKKATLTIKVTAKGVTPTGKVTIKLGSKKLKTVTLKKGKATAVLTKQKKGKRAYKVVYAGDTKVSAKTVTSKKITIK